MLTSKINIRIEDLTRINVVGVSGSGKSWLSRRLADQLSVKRIELDQLYWGPNWTEPEPPVFRRKLETTIQCDRWVLDGNYHSKTHDIKWRDVTMVVWIDNSFAPTFSQAFVRAVKRIWHKEEIWPDTNNRDSFHKCRECIKKLTGASVLSLVIPGKGATAALAFPG